MLAVESTKLQVLNQVRYLFSVRPDTFRATRWNCVLRDDQLIVILSEEQLYGRLNRSQ